MTAIEANRRVRDDITRLTTAAVPAGGIAF